MVKRHKTLLYILATLLLFGAIWIPTTTVEAQSMIVSGPGTVSAGQNFTVTLSVSPAQQIMSFAVNISYDSRLTFVGHSPLVGGLSPSITIGSGSLIFGYAQGSTAVSASGIVSLTFRAASAGTYVISAGEADFGTSGGGVSYASGGSTTVVAQAAAQPEVPAATPTPLPTVGPTPKPTPTPTIPQVTPPTTTERETEPSLTDPETGEEIISFLTFGGTRIFPSEQEIPEGSVPFDYFAEWTTVDEASVQVLRADDRPSLFWLENEDGEAGFYLYWSSEDRYLPYQLLTTISDSFVILPAPFDADLPDGFQAYDLEINGELFPAYRASSERYRSIWDLDRDVADAAEAEPTGPVVVYARVQRVVTPVAPEPEEVEGEEVEEEPEPEPEWTEGEFYLFDEERQMLFPLSLLMVYVPEVVVTPTPEPSPTPTPTVTVPVETIPVDDAEPVVRLFGYEYGLWKTIIFVLGFLLLLTWLIQLIRSIGRNAREKELEMEREREFQMQAERRDMARRRAASAEAAARRPAFVDTEPTPTIESRPDIPPARLVTPPSEPLRVDPEDVRPDPASRRRSERLPEMPTLDTPRPTPLPTVRNTKRTHADEMVIRPLPTEPEPSVDTKTEPDVVPQIIRPERPQIRRVDPPKPRIRRPERPPIDGDDNSEI